MSEVSQSPEPTSYVVEGNSYRELIAQRDAYKRVANDLARQLRERTPADSNAPAERAPSPPAAELAAGIEWLKQEICDGEEYLQRYPNSVDELAQQEHRQRLLDAITGSAQPPIDARVHPDTHLIDSLGMRSTLNDIAARADSTKSACCRQSPCLHPGVGPCDMPAVEKEESPEPGRSQSSGLSASPDAENIGRPSHDESQCWEPCGALGKSEEHARDADETSTVLPCGCDIARTAKWIRRECGCLPPDRDLRGDPTDI